MTVRGITAPSRKGMVFLDAPEDVARRRLEKTRALSCCHASPRSLAFAESRYRARN